MNTLISIFTYSLLITILFSISIAIAFPLFEKYYDRNIEGFFPVYNLFKLCYIVGLNEFIGLLYIIPGINILLMILTGFKLKDRVETYSIFKIGFIVLPIIFIPLAAYIRYKESSPKETFIYKDNSNETDKREENVIIETEPEEPKAEERKEIVEESTDEPSRINLEDDSIFKLQSKIKIEKEGENKPYKAKKVMVNERFINSAPAEQETIKKVDRNDD